MPLYDFVDTTLGRQFASYKWARNNTVQILKVAQKSEIMNFTPCASQHSILYQFQCLVATDDAYYRRLTNDRDKRFGVRIEGEKVIEKRDLLEKGLAQLLAGDIVKLESLLMSFTSQQFEDRAQDIQSLYNHEYLHQGQLVVLFRQAGVELPERFAKAFDL